VITTLVRYAAQNLSLLLAIFYLKVLVVKLLRITYRHYVRIVTLKKGPNLARKSNGWVKIYSKILEEDLTPSQFKFFVGSILLANPPKTNGAGTVDLTIRQMADALKMSRSEIWRREKELAELGLIKFKDTGFLVTKYEYYQSGQKTVPPTGQSANVECPAHGTVSPAHGTVTIPSVPPTGQSVPFLEPVPPHKKEEDNTKKINKKHEPSVPDPFNEDKKKVFEGLKNRRGFNSPNAGGEAKAITWMLKQQYNVEQILACYDSLKKDPFWSSKPLFMMSVKSNIGEFVKKGTGDGKVVKSASPYSTAALKASIGKPLG
jgi:hypothetical protein